MPRNMDAPSEQESDILIKEVEQAISKLKNNKVPGPDGVTTEMLKIAEEKRVEILWKICNQVWSTGKCPMSRLNPSLSHCTKKDRFKHTAITEPSHLSPMHLTFYLIFYMQG
ncbi:hypothetical protein PGB90_000466 [Kerria lacca]